MSCRFHRPLLAGTVSLAIGAAALPWSWAQSLPTGALKPFVYVELYRPANTTIDAGTMVDVNSAGDVGCTFRSTQGAQPTLVGIWDDADDAWMELPREVSAGVWASLEATATAINDNRELSGWFDAGLGVINASRLIDDTEESIGNHYIRQTIDDGGVPVQGYAMDINNDGDVVGTNVAGTSAAGFINGNFAALPGFSGGGLLDRGAYGVRPLIANLSETTVFVAGQAKRPNDSTHGPVAVVWDVTTGGTVIRDLTDSSDQPSTSYYDRAWAVNDYGDAVVVRYDASTHAPYKGYFCERTGTTTWTRTELPSGFTEPRALNNASDPEVVGGEYLWTAPGATTALLDLTTLATGWPTVSSPYTQSMAATSINDSGEIAGLRVYTDANGTHRVPFKLVPRDDNGNSVPDYRECLADPANVDDDGDYVLDWDFAFRAGLYGVGQAEHTAIEDIV